MQSPQIALVAAQPVAVWAKTGHDCGKYRQRRIASLDDMQDISGGGQSLVDQAGLLDQAGNVANFLKALGHDGRLTILCHLRTGPKSVTELENLLSSRQAVVSQQLARLRLEGMVSARREGQAIFYSLLDPKVAATIETLARLFPKPS